MLGVQAGGLVHVAAAAFGVSAVIASSATAFTIVKYAGAAYLIALGLRRLLFASSAEDAEPEPCFSGLLRGFPRGRPGQAPGRPSHG